MTAIQTKGAGRSELLDSSAIALVVSPAPFTPRTEIHTAPAGVTIAGLVAFGCNHGTLEIADVDRIRLYVDGVELELRESLDLVPAPGATVNLAVTVHGSARTFVQLFFQIGAAVVGAMFGPVWGTAVALVGQVVDYVFFGRGGSDELAEANDRGALQDQSNEYRRRSSFPIVAGKQRVGFDVAALPYTQLRGNEVWLHVIMGLHYGPCTLEDVRIGETLLADFPAGDVQIETFLTPGPRNVQSYPSRVAQTNLNDELDLAGGGVWEVRTAPAGIERIEIDIAHPRGLKFTSDKGKIGTEEVTGRIEYAEEGTEAWAPAQIGQFRKKNGAVLPAGTFYTMDRTNEPVRRTFGFEVPDKSKRWKVRVKAWDDEGRYPEDNGIMDTVWTAIRGIERVKPILDETLSVIALSVKSSGDLNGTLPLVTGIVEPIVPVWDAAETTWLDDPADWQPSSNAAAIARWLCTSSAAAHPLDADEEIDASAGFAYELIVEHGWTGGIDFRDEVTLADALAALGRMGRFTCYWNGRALCFVPDWEKPAPRQLFTGKNAEGYRYRKSYQDEPHGVFVEFKNLDSDSAGDELKVFADGYDDTNAEEFLSLRLDFACTAERAFKEARVFLAKRKHQTESHEWTAGIESLISTYGDRVLVRHATALWGIAEVRVRARKMAGALVSGVRLSDPVVMEAGKTYAIDIQREDQTIRGVEVVTVVGQVRDLTFPEPLAVSQAPRPGDLIAVGEVGFVTEDLEIVDIEPDGELSATIRAVRYAAAEIEAAETGPIPPLPNLLTPKQAAPVPRLVGTPQGSPDGVIVAFDIDPVRAAAVEGFAARWRVEVETPEGGVSSWTSVPPLGPQERVIRTPAFTEAQHEPGDAEALITVDLEVRTLMRNGDRSLPLSIVNIPITKGVPAPIDFYAEGVVRTAPDGSAFTAIAAGCDPIEAGQIHELRVEVAPDDGSGPEADTWRALGQPLPARNPRGDFLDVDAGEGYAVRAQWRTEDGWPGPWVELSGASRVIVPAGGDKASEVVNLNGEPVSDVLGRLADTQQLVDQVAIAVEELEETYGSTASAAASAAAAATSAASAAAQEALAEGHAEDASAAAVAASGSAGNAATAASGAAASANDAAGSATAALASQTAAASSAGAAGTSATQASTSATNAAGSASAASTSATNAANSATAAGGSASAASGSASSAGTSATNAGNSATAAAASQVTARLTAAQTLPSTFVRDGETWFAGYVGRPEDVTPLAPNSTFTFPSPTGIGKVIDVDMTAGDYRDFAPIGWIKVDPAATYRLRMEVRASVWSNAPTAQLYWIGYAADGTQNTSGLLGNWSAATLTPTPGYPYASAWGAIQADITGAVLAANGVIYVRPMARQRTGGGPGNSYQVRLLSIVDATERVAAGASATAAATSASSASTSAGAAGVSATAASGSATTASTAAGNASTYASQASTSAGNAAGSATAAGTSATNAAGSAATATTQASNASASATSASTSASIAAGVGTGAVNKNSGFDNYPWTTGAPVDWAGNWGVEGCGRFADGAGGYGMQLDSPAGQNSGVYQLLDDYTVSGGQYYVIEADVLLWSGDYTASGLYVDFRNSAASLSVGTAAIQFAAEPDDDQRTVAWSVSRRKFSKLVYAPSGSYRAYFYAMGHFSGFGSITAANGIRFYDARIRKADSREIAAGVALPALQAQVTTQAGVIATVQGRTAAWWETIAAAGSDPAYARLTADGYGSAIALGAREIALLNPVGGTFMKTLQVINNEVRVSRKLVVGTSTGVGQIEIDAANQRIDVKDEAGTLRLRIGKLT